MYAMCPAQTILLVKINSWVLHVHGRNSRVTTFPPYRMDSIIETTVTATMSDSDSDGDPDNLDDDNLGFSVPDPCEYCIQHGLNNRMLFWCL